MMINKKVLIYFFTVLIIILNAGVKSAEADRNYQNLRDPFHSVFGGEERPADEASENDEKEVSATEIIATETEMMLELIEQEMSEKLRQIEIAGFFGEDKKYYIIFKGDSRIYKEKDRLNMDRNIEIDKIDVDLVDLVADLGNGKRLYKKIFFKVK